MHKAGQQADNSNRRAPQRPEEMSDGDKLNQAEMRDAVASTKEPPHAEPCEAAQQKPKTKKTKADKTDGSVQVKPTKAKSERDPSQPRAKRGPARPHRRLTSDVIDSRIAKLQKRLDRAKSQIEDAGRHVEGYLRERDFRAKEAGGA